MLRDSFSEIINLTMLEKLSVEESYDQNELERIGGNFSEGACKISAGRVQRESKAILCRYDIPSNLPNEQFLSISKV
jgi:hypothetical protein